MAWSMTDSHSTSSSVSNTQNASQSQSESTTRKILDDALLARIMGGLMGYMTDEEIALYAENLLRPQLNAGLEASQQTYETTKLAKEQEIENLAASLAKAIEGQQGAYKQSMANVETAAMSRGMGRSSYTMQTLANQGDALAKAVQQLTDENRRQSGQLMSQISQAARQNAQTQGRLNTDYASQLAATIQQIRNDQRNSWNQNYMTAVSGAMGSQTTGTQSSTGTSNTQTQSSTSSSSVTTSGSGGGSGKKRDPIGYNPGANNGGK